MSVPCIIWDTAETVTLLIEMIMNFKRLFFCQICNFEHTSSIKKIGPQCVLVWDFIDKVFARGFWAEANLSLTVSQLYYRGDIRPGINSLNSNFCAGIIWTNTDSQEGSGVLTYTFIKQYAFPSLPGSFLACFWTFGNRLQQINYLLVA